MVHEEWRPVVGFEGYEVSSHGRVRSFRRSPTGRVLVGNRITNGYLQLDLRRGTGKATRAGKLIHCLVLEAFVGPRPDGHEACHNDGDQLNNHLSNLRWDTHVENALDTKRHGRHFQANKAECPRGHEYSHGNVYFRPSGGRGCKTCRVEATRRYRARRQTCG